VGEGAAALFRLTVQQVARLSPKTGTYLLVSGFVLGLQPGEYRVEVDSSNTCETLSGVFNPPDQSRRPRARVMSGPSWMSSWISRWRSRTTPATTRTSTTITTTTVTPTLRESWRSRWRSRTTSTTRSTTATTTTRTTTTTATPTVRSSWQPRWRSRPRTTAGPTVKADSGRLGTFTVLSKRGKTDLEFKSDILSLRRRKGGNNVDGRALVVRDEDGETIACGIIDAVQNKGEVDL